MNIHILLLLLSLYIYIYYMHMYIILHFCVFDQVTVLYFLRNRTDKDVDPSHMERDIFCGELKHNTIEALSSLLSDIYIPIARAQNDWGHCNEEGQTHLMHSMDKFVIALNETAASMRHSRQWVSWPCL